MLARALIAFALAVVLAGCAPGPSLFGPSTGTVTGHVQIRACGGAYRPGQTSCPTHPYAGVTLTFTLASAVGTGSEKATTTDSSGSYRIDLGPGTYTVRASGPGDQVGSLSDWRQVVVTAGKTVTADFVFVIELL